METEYQIRSAYRDEWDDAMALAWKTFLRFEADVYSPEGVKHFEDFITDTTLHRMFIMGPRPPKPGLLCHYCHTPLR